MASSTTNADQIVYDAAEDLGEEMKKEPYSLMIRVGWTFSGGEPSGEYALKIPNHDNIGEKFSNGVIVIKNRLKVLKGTGELEITPTNGPTYRSKVILGPLSNTQTPAGLAQRLTNLGFYAGTDGIFNGRMAWAVRAFKRIKINDYTRNKVEVENNAATKAFLIAVQNAFGVHPGDEVTGDLSLTFSNAAVPYCGMFGNHVYKRGNFENAKLKNDVDNGPKATGIWGGVSAAEYKNEPIAGEYELHLRAFDPKTEDAFSNRVNLPQPIHMAQFVLFELGYWLVGGNGNWVQLDNTWTRNSFKPDGGFGRYTQWAVREFQCHAKLGYAAKEDVDSTEKRYMPRLFKLSQSPPKLTGDARYPDDGRISGALNEKTRAALQAWADGVLRCPVIVYATTDTRDGSNLDKIVKENLWLHNDLASNNPRMYAIDYSNYYFNLPLDLFPPQNSYNGLVSRYGGKVTFSGNTFPKPIVLGYYDKAYDGGPCVVAGRHTWDQSYVEIRPDTLIGKGGNNGIGLSDKELSTFKVIRTVSHFECYAFFDCINAYDDVTISFGPCHWTAHSCMGGEADATGARELPAFLAYVKYIYPENYKAFFGVFGLGTKSKWPIKISGGVNTYNDKFMMQTEDGEQNLYGNSDRLNENKYLKSWHWFYRFIMATRISTYLHRAMWHFTRIRIGDILNHEFEFTIGQGKETKTKKIKVGQYATSEKAVVMLLRYHIRYPGNLFTVLKEIMKDLISKFPNPENDKIEKAREDEMISKILEKSQLRDNESFRKQMRDLNSWVDVPQLGFPKREYYELNLIDKTLSSEPGSFKFDDLPVQVE